MFIEKKWAKPRRGDMFIEKNGQNPVGVTCLEQIVVLIIRTLPEAMTAFDRIEMIRQH
jgi:hypothetical protein